MRKIPGWIFFCLFSLWGVTSWAACGGSYSGSSPGTITSYDCNVDCVTAAVGAAENGDTVIIPTGSCSWTSGITSSKQIKIKGEAKGSVLLTLSCPTCTGEANGFVMFNMTTGTSYSTEIANINFLTDIASGTQNPNSIYIKINGLRTDKPPLIHDNLFKV